MAGKGWVGIFLGWMLAGQLGVAATCEDVSIENLTPEAKVSAEGVHIGNGGDVLVKKTDGEIEQVVLLDFYEAEELRGIFRDLGGASLSTTDKIEIALSRWQEFDEKRVAMYRDWLATFENEACFKRNIRLRDLDDSQHQFTPDEPGWEIQQIAIQIEPMIPGDPRYIIDLDLWDRLDNDGKAGLILHELVYRDASAFHIENSRGIRYLTSVFTSNHARDWSQYFYVERLHDLGIGTVSVNGLWFDISQRQLNWHDEQTVASGEPVYGTEFESRFGRLHLRCIVGFSEAGELKYFTLDSMSNKPTITIAGQDYRVSPRAPFEQPCADMDSLDYQWSVDFWTSHQDLDEGSVVFHMADVNDYFDEAAALYHVTVSGYHYFYQGRVDRAMVGPGWSDANPFVLLNGRRCELDAGIATFAHELQAPGGMPIPRCGVLQWCSLAIPGAAHIEIVKHACWSIGEETFTLESGQFAGDEEIVVHPDNPRSTYFKKSFTLHPSGAIESGQLLTESVMLDIHGARVMVPANAYATFTEDGKLRGFSPIP